jgi:TM2 domain-containing membrane protein YozV
MAPFPEKELRELERDAHLSKRQHLTIRLMYKCYGKQPRVYVLLALTLGWLGIHRLYAERDIMSGLMLPVSMLFLVCTPIFLFSGWQNSAQIGIGGFFFLVLVSWCEIPFHLISIRAQNRSLKQFLQTHVKV